MVELIANNPWLEGLAIMLAFSAFLALLLGWMYICMRLHVSDFASTVIMVIPLLLILYGTIVYDLAQHEEDCCCVEVGDASLD